MTNDWLKQSIQMIKKEDLCEGRLLWLRLDGMVLFDSDNKKDSTNLGVLISSAWQATSAMGQHASLFDDQILSWISNDLNLHVSKILNNKQSWLLALIYSNDEIPGKMRFKLTSLKEKLSEQNSQTPVIEKSIQNNSSYLFQEISDQEIEMMFKEMV